MGWGGRVPVAHVVGTTCLLSGGGNRDLDLVATLFAVRQQPVPAFILAAREAVEYRESDDDTGGTES
jgi:hypothetical protein